MRRAPRPSYDFHRRICPECGWIFLPDGSLCPGARCGSCNEPLITFKCTGTACKFSKKICVRCCDNFGESERNKRREADLSEDRQTLTNKNWGYCILFILLFVVFIIIYGNSSSESYADVSVMQLKRLKAEYASQKNETWWHLLSVLEKEIPSVKSVTFLHGEDRTTLNCLTSALVSLYTANSKIKLQEVTFSMTESEARDYGFFLEHYHTVVEKFRVLVTDLSKVPGNIARIFHSLCDEVSSDIKPSLFIFTLKYDRKTASLKPLERATTILKEAWWNLPQNEISPLLSRIIKNVIDVVPEGKVPC